MGHGNYILNANGEPEEIVVWRDGQIDVPALHRWGTFFESRSRIVKQERVAGWFVSTVFLGLDHSFKADGPPVLWETMAFHPLTRRYRFRFRLKGTHREKKRQRFANRKHSQYSQYEQQSRCSGSREQAEAMHEAMKERVLALVALNWPEEPHHETP